MNKVKVALIAVVFSITSGIATSALFTTTNSYAAVPAPGPSCPSASPFFLLPHWYDNLSLSISNDGKSCAVVLTAPEDVWIIVLNAVNILLRLTGLAAVLFIIVGGVRYITSQGSSSGITAAKQTIVRALTGLAISIVAVLIVSYVSSVFGKTVHPDANYRVSVVNEVNYV